MERLLLLNCVAFVPLLKINEVYLCGPLSGFSIDFMSVPLPVPQCLDYRSYTASPNIRESDFSQFKLFKLVLIVMKVFPLQHVHNVQCALWHMCVPFVWS